MEKRIFIFSLALLFILILRLSIFYSQKPKFKDKERIKFNTVLLQEPKNLYDYQTLSVQDQVGNRIFIKTSISPAYNYGDNLLISGNLSIKLLNKNQLITMNYPEIRLVNNNKDSFLAVIGDICQKIITVFKESFPRDFSSLMLGIVFGIKQDFSKNFLDSLRIAGVMHVIAASGMNITLVSGFVLCVSCRIPGVDNKGICYGYNCFSSTNTGETKV